MPRTRDSTRKRRPTAKASAFRLGLRPPLRGTKYHNQVPNDDSALRNAHPSPKKRKRLSRRSTRQASESSERESEKYLAQKRTRTVISQLSRIRLEQALLDAYEQDGWRGASLEKLKPERELKRAEAQILKSKLIIRNVLRDIDQECLFSKQQLEAEPDETIVHDNIFCATCGGKDAEEDNDILLCDGVCNRAFHQQCCKPAVATEDIPPGDEGWLCYACSSKYDIIWYINQTFTETTWTVNDPWMRIFAKEAEEQERGTKMRHGARETEHDTVDPAVSDMLASDGSDYDPDDLEDVAAGSDDYTTSSQDTSHDDESGSLAASDEEATLMRTVRRRKRVDYRKLNDELFGCEEAYEGEVDDAVQDAWDPGDLDTPRG